MSSNPFDHNDDFFQQYWSGYDPPQSQPTQHQRNASDEIEDLLQRLSDSGSPPAFPLTGLASPPPSPSPVNLPSPRQLAGEDLMRANREARQWDAGTAGERREAVREGVERDQIEVNGEASTSTAVFTPPPSSTRSAPGRATNVDATPTSGRTNNSQHRRGRSGLCKCSHSSSKSCRSPSHELFGPVDDIQPPNKKTKRLTHPRGFTSEVLSALGWSRIGNRIKCPHCEYFLQYEETTRRKGGMLRSAYVHRHRKHNLEDEEKWHEHDEEAKKEDDDDC